MYNVSSNFLSAVAGNNRTVKLKATFNSKTELDGEHLFNYTLTEMINSEGITMGAVCSNKIEIKMAMPSTAIALANGWVEPKVGLEINGSVEYVPLGKFYITEIESKDDYKTVTITGYDGMCKLEEDYETTITTWPASISDVVNDIATQYGFNIATTTFPSYTIDYIEGTCREYLGWIAGLMGKNARFNKDGKLEFKWYEVVEVSTQGASVEYGTLIADEGSYSNGVLTLGTGFSVSGNTLVYSGSGSGNLSISRALQYQNGMERTRTDSFTVSSITSGTEDNVLVAGNGVGITFENPFMTQEILNSIKTAIGTVTFNPCEVKWKGNPALEVGDIVTVKDKNNSDLTVYVMEQTIYIGGGISGEIFCYGESETSIAFSTEGPTSKKIKQVYSTLQEAIKEATELINGANGGIFKLTDSDNDGINDGWLLAEHDGPLTATTKCIVGNYQGIGLSTDGGATYTQAITHQGIVGSAIVAGSITAEKIDVIPYSKLSGTPDLDVYITKGGTVGSTPAEGSTGFKVSTAGLLTASNAVIYGTIYSSAGKVGGFTLDDNKMYSLSSNNTYTIVNGTNYAFIAGAESLNNVGTAPFRVTHAGALFASSGTIGGWTIGSSKIYGTADNGKVAVVQLPTSNTNYVFAAGGTSHDSYADCPFRVTKTGELYSTSGVIGGFQIGSARLLCTASNELAYLSINSYTYDTTNHNAIIIGTRSSTDDSYTTQFRVRYDGSVYMNNATITGNSTIASACIPNLSASKITSGTISTDRLDTSVITTSNFSSKTLSTTNLTVASGCRLGVASEYNAVISTRANYTYLLAYGPSTTYEVSFYDIVKYIANNASNRDVKKEIHDFDDRYDAFFDKLKPQLYKYNFEVDNGYTMGYIWQDVDEAVNSSNLTRNDVGAIYESEGVVGGLALSKQDFIALNTWQIQKLKARVAELEAKLDSVI